MPIETTTPHPAPAPGGLSGAGIVQKVAGPRGGPATYVLTDRNGRMLALLQPAQGVNLESLVGQPVGLIGPRGFDPRMRADVIQVVRAVPVQLAP